ncbi:hypothetical protein BE221DRAFT_72848 [Ostreococcus tauri]|uniref:Uncharacterized protein n=1 Tax=Ostreococcus tauri TaxID=70448 RepID=A0A1Y5IB70_OSTTA|nr:hypothetical protein BE221DRAFT_72848 [Ostreococcus tauri]
MEGYRARYVVPGKFAPLKHFMVGVFALAFGLETYHHHNWTRCSGRLRSSGRACGRCERR